MAAGCSIKTINSTDVKKRAAAAVVLSPPSRPQARVPCVLVVPVPVLLPLTCFNIMFVTSSILKLSRSIFRPLLPLPIFSTLYSPNYSNFLLSHTFLQEREVNTFACLITALFIAGHSRASTHVSLFQKCSIGSITWKLLHVTGKRVLCWI